METKNPARCTMSMSATHTSGFNTGSDNQNKWLLFPLYSACQRSPLKGGGGGDAKLFRERRGKAGLGRGCRPQPPGVHGLSAARVNICFAGLGRGASASTGRRWPWGSSFSFPRRGSLGGQPPGGQTSTERAPARSCPRGSSLGGPDQASRASSWPLPGLLGPLASPRASWAGWSWVPSSCRCRGPRWEARTLTWREVKVSPTGPKAKARPGSIVPPPPEGSWEPGCLCRLEGPRAHNLSMAGR